jgi:hypothetical protein
VPGPDDVAQTGAYTVTIDGNITCTRLEATSSGHFEVTSGGITVNADFTMASSYTTNGGFRCTHTTGTVTLNGAIVPSATTNVHAVVNAAAGTLTLTGLGAQVGANALVVRNVSTGTLNITATSITGGAGSSDYVVNNISTGALNITADVIGGAGTAANAIYNTAGGTVTLTGNATGGAGSTSCGIYNASTGTINISGTATGGSDAGAYGIMNYSTGTATCDMAVAGSVLDSFGIYGRLTGGTTTYKRIGSQADGNSAIGGFCKMALDADYNVIVVKDADGNDVSMSNDYPAVTAVINSVTYNRTTLVGTFAIPAEADVKDGVLYGAAGTEFEGEWVSGMTNTRLILTPQAAEFPSTNFPQLLTIHSTERRFVLAYDGATAETAMWTAVVPQGWTGTVNAVISYCMSSATSGGVAFSVTLEAVTSADALDLDTATGYDTTNTGTDAAVPGTAGYMDQITIALSNLDSAAAGDLLRISVTRAVDNAADTATGDCYVLAVEIKDAV